MQKELITKTLCLNESNVEEFRSKIRCYFHATFDLYELLFEGLSKEESYYERADRLRHPLIFYFGHTAVFFINKLNTAKLINERINPSFESMFAIGVDEMSWDDLDDKNYDWPSVARVKAYRDQVRSCVDELICNLPLNMPVDWQSPFWPILMGIEHERIHLETSSVLIRQLPLSMVKAHPAWPICRDFSDEVPGNDFVEIPAYRVQMAKNRQHDLYGWDNEYGVHAADVSAFRAARYLTSNGEYREFVEAGGYADDVYWEEEGLQWRNFRKAEMPHFWRRNLKGVYSLRCLLQEIEMCWSWPVEVNYHEAKAYCNWKSRQQKKSIRLPSEEEWFSMREQSYLEDQPFWDQAPGNINLEHFASSCPVNQFQHGQLCDVIGNVWQWTESTITGFEGFETHAIYDDFSTPTFDGRHNLIKGGSWISTGNEATKHARYAFRRHFFQHAGFRCIESEVDVLQEDNTYETDALISQYCEFHYGATAFGVESFHKELAAIGREVCGGHAKRALDLGCSVGRLSFELADFADHVTGLDFSANFIKVALTLRDQKRICYTFREEGDIVSFHEKTLAGLSYENLFGEVEFYQADACNLAEKFSGYDLVIAANLIDRLYSPRKFLKHIGDRIHSGGYLIIASPYTWLEEFTPREEWLGGYKRDGENVMTLDGLKEALEGYFEIVGEPRSVAFVIRETKRKFQHTVSEVTVWRRM